MIARLAMMAGGAAFLLGKVSGGVLIAILCIATPIEVLHKVLSVWQRIAAARQDAQRHSWRRHARAAARLLVQDVIRRLAVVIPSIALVGIAWVLVDRGVLDFHTGVVIAGLAVLVMWPLLGAMVRGRGIVLVFRPFNAFPSQSFVKHDLVRAVKPFGRVVTLADHTINAQIHTPIGEFAIIGFFLGFIPLYLLFGLLAGYDGRFWKGLMFAGGLASALLVRRAAALWLRFEVMKGHHASQVAERVRRLCRSYWLRPIVGSPVAVLAMNATWQDAVSALLRIADAVVLDTTRPSGSLRWELERSMTLLPPDRIFVVADPHKRGDESAVAPLPVPDAVQVVEYGPRGYLIELRLRLLLERVFHPDRTLGPDFVGPDQGSTS